VHYSNVRGHEAHASDFPYKAGAFEKHIKEVLMKGCNFFAPLEVRAIKSHLISVFFKWSCNGIAAACIPPVNDLLIKGADRGLISSSR
jgi:hypothetical protein